MKFKAFIILFAIGLSFSLSSCDKEESISKGKVEFNATIENLLKAYSTTNSADSLKEALIEIKNSNQEIIISNEKLQLTKFGDSYISEPIDLPVGSFTLTKFLLLNEYDEVVYTTPIEESEKAYLVSDPLPINFAVEEDIISKVSPEVINAEGQMPEDFGYTTFGFNVVETYDFLIAAFIYVDTINNFSLTEANIEVSSNLDILYEGNLKPLTNQITVNAGYSSYTITVTKSGYQEYQKVVPEDSLTIYFSEPIMVILQKQDINDGLIAYYPFNENTNDESGNSNHATNHGANLTMDRFGNTNSAYEFDGVDDYIILPSDFDLEYRTISVWFNKSDSEPQCQRIYYSDHPNLKYSSTTIDIIIENNVSLLRFEIGGGMSKSLTIAIQEDIWYNAVLKCDGSNTSAYLNGVLIDNAPYVNHHSDNAVNFTAQLGTNRTLYNYFLNGQIDDLRIYNRVLSDSEILELYNE
jgi:hypothetical protein